MVDAITTHIKWMQASETKELSFTQLYFFTDYILDILNVTVPVSFISFLLITDVVDTPLFV